MASWDDVRRLALAMPDAAKEALLAEPSGVFFTTPQFDGHASVLVRLSEIDPAELEEVVVEAWLARAPPKLAEAYQAERLDS